jgi:cytochrome c-type biogenesis protein CcmH
MRGDTASPAASPVAAVVSVFLMVGGAAALYATWSNWSWPAADPAAATTPAEMVSQLARRLESEPGDVAGWLMLGRSYAALGQFPLAARAYQRADRLEGGRNVEALTGWAEALALSNEAELAGRAGRLFEKALEIEPTSPKALFFGAVAAQRRGELPLALSRFETLLSNAPPDNVRPLLEQQVAALKAAIAGVPVAAAPAAGPEAPATAASRPAGAAGADAEGSPVATVRLRIRVGPALAGRVPDGAPLFVFVRFPGQPGPPVAVKRLPANLPQQVELTPADSPMGGRGFGAGDKVEVTARIALGGAPTASAGDPYGQLGYEVGRDGEQELVIDRLTP